MQACVLKLWKDKEKFHDEEIFQDMEGLALNPLEIQNMEMFQDMKHFQDMEARHHTLYILNPSE